VLPHGRSNIVRLELVDEMQQFACAAALGPQRDVRAGTTSERVTCRAPKSSQARRRLSHMGCTAEPSRESSYMTKPPAHADLDAGWLVMGMRPAIAEILGEVATINHRLEGRLSANVARGLERVAHGAALLERLVGDLGDLAMADTGSFDLQLEPVDLGQLLAEAVYHAMPVADRARVSLELCHVAVASIDAARVLRTLATVLHHAATTGLPTTPIVVRLERKRDRAHISITDHGPGNNAQPGMTIGFYVGRKLIEAHGGRMCVDSVPGRSWKMSVELPVVS
jgi:light-regulated signal transduction histidine kinase (bacteriophytochrome)